MRKLLILSALVAGLATPAFAAWQDFLYPELNFSVTFPSEPKLETISYTAPDGSSLSGKMYSVTQDDNIYRIKIVDFSGNTISRTAIIKAAVDYFRGRGEVAEDIYARIGSDFGRNLHTKEKDGTVDYLSIYFANNRKLYIIEGVKTPASKNAYALRFKESISFIQPPGAAGGRGGAGGAGGGRGGRGGAGGEGGGGRGAPPADGAGRGAPPAGGAAPQP